MGPASLGGLNNAATPSMPTGVSPTSSDYGGKHMALLLEGEIEKNAASQDPNAMPYHTHMKGSLGCLSGSQGGIFCYGGRVFRMVDAANNKYLDIQTASDNGRAIFDISFDSELPNLDNYRFYYTPADFSPTLENPLALITCPNQGCTDPAWDSMMAQVQSESVPRQTSSTSPNVTPPSSDTMNR